MGQPVQEQSRENVMFVFGDYPICWDQVPKELVYETYNTTYVMEVLGPVGFMWCSSYQGYVLGCDYRR